MPTPNLPSFDNAKTYVFSGMALNRLMSELRRITPRAGQGLNATETVNGIVLTVNGNDDGNTYGDAAGGFRHPFRVVINDGNWTVLSDLSSVTDGTNGTEITLPAGFDTPNAITGRVWIVLEADVDTDLVVSNWTLTAATSAADAAEVGTGGSPVAQTKLRLLIAIVGGLSADGPALFQCVNTAQRITHGLLNGLPVKVFEAAPVNPNN